MIEVGQYFTYKFVSVQNYFTWYRWAYAPHTRSEKLECWEEITAIKELCEGPWTSCGDFNTVRFMRERRGCNRIKNAMSEFSK